MYIHTGARLSWIGDFCTKSNSTAGDGIDNDCDDQIDEELHNGVDDDGDGLIGKICIINLRESEMITMTARNSQDMKLLSNVINKSKLRFSTYR